MIEIRFVLFTDAEVVSSLVEFRRARRDPLPPGAVRGLERVIDKDNIKVILHISADNGNRVAVEFDKSGLAAALVLFCINRKVPLPASAEKDVQILEGMISLQLSLKPKKKGEGAEAQRR